MGLTRVTAVDVAALPPDDRKIYDAIAGPRGAVGGPFAAWFIVPDIAGLVNNLVDRLRYGSKLEPRINELITLIVAHAWSAEFIWRAHSKAAQKAGVSEAAIAAIEHGQPPAFDLPDEAVTYAFLHALLTRQTVDDDLYLRANDCFGQAEVTQRVAGRDILVDPARELCPPRAFVGHT